MPDPQVERRPVARITGTEIERIEDAVAVEGALEMRIGGRTLAVTLRTPGHDEDLALGFLAAEGLIGSRSDVVGLRAIPASCAHETDAVEIALAPGVPLDWTKLERHFAATSACGLCGRAHLDSLRAGLEPIPVGEPFAVELLEDLPDRLLHSQVSFTATGGLHAAAFCDGPELEAQVLREDVGRHNAVDKVCGWLLERGRYPASGGVLWVSGRAGAEIVLKAARARIPVLAAVGAPTSLAIGLAETAAMTLIGFLREGRMNVYSGEQRIAS